MMTILLNDNALTDQRFNFQQTSNILTISIELDYPDYSVLSMPTTLIVKDQNDVEIINMVFNAENIFKSVSDNHTFIRLNSEIS